MKLIDPSEVDRRIFTRLERYFRPYNIEDDLADHDSIYTISIQLANGKVIVIDVEKVLRQRVNSDVVAKALADPDAFDDSYMHEEARGHMRGGRRHERDRDFGISDRNFWDWWHDHKQKNHLGDIETREECHKWYSIYESERTAALRSCAFYSAINELPDFHQVRLRAALTIISAA